MSVENADSTVLVKLVFACPDRSACGDAPHLLFVLSKKENEGLLTSALILTLEINLTPLH